METRKKVLKELEKFCFLILSLVFLALSHNKWFFTEVIVIISSALVFLFLNEKLKKIRPKVYEIRHDFHKAHSKYCEAYRNYCEAVKDMDDIKRLDRSYMEKVSCLLIHKNRSMKDQEKDFRDYKKAMEKYWKIVICLVDFNYTKLFNSLMIFIPLIILLSIIHIAKNTKEISQLGVILMLVLFLSSIIFSILVSFKGIKKQLNI